MYKKSARNVKQNGSFKDIIAMQLALIIRVSLPVFFVEAFKVLHLGVFES